MSRPVILRPEVAVDLREAFDWLELARPGLGERFRGDLSATLEYIEANPEMSGIVWRNVRAIRLRKFRYVVYYVCHDDRVDVLAVLHGAQHERNWKSRGISE
jgi:toxin ParE1/3/4